QLLSNFRRRKNEIYRSRGNGVVRHSTVTSRAFILGKGDAAFALDAANAVAAVGSVSREDNSNGLAALDARQRLEERVDGQMQTTLAGRQAQYTVFQYHGGIG